MSNKRSKSVPIAGWKEHLTKGVWPYLIIFLLVFLVFGQVLGFFLGKFDEDLIILGNLKYLTNPGNFGDAFFRDAFFSDKGVEFYRPLQNLSFMFDAMISGYRGWGYYLTNILIHALTSSLVFYLLTLFMRNRLTAMLLAILFAVDPLFVHAVAWAPARGDLLVALFGMISIISWLVYLRKGKSVMLAVHLVSFALAVLSKEIGMLLPLLYIIFYILPATENHFRGWKPLVVPLIGYVIVVSIYLLFRSVVVNTPPKPEEFGIFPMLNNIRTIPEYLSKFALPVFLAPMSGFTWFNTIAGVLLFTGLVVLILRNRNQRWLLPLAGLAWFLLLVAPGVMYSHDLGSYAYDYLEHRAYFPMIGIILLTGVLLDSSGEPAKKYPRRHSGYISLLLVFFILIFGVRSFSYARHYENPMTFYNLATSANPESAMAFSNRGLVKHEIKQEQAAIEDFNIALRIWPGYAKALVNRGISRNALNDVQGAMQDYQAALELEPDLFQAVYNKANLDFQHGRRDDAIAGYNRALELNPNYYPGYFMRGTVKFQVQDFDGAISDFNQAISLSPEYTEAFLNRGKAYYMLKDMESACRDWKQALSLGNSEAGTLLEKYCR